MTGKLLIISGAGLSAESGIQTFRDKDGLWEGHAVEEVCHIATWRQNYDTVHRFYNERRARLKEVEPNGAHRQIAAWERRLPVLHFTQNVDDLLERGGSTDAIHLHGTLTAMHCQACDHQWEIGYTPWDENDRCPRARCGSRHDVKPAIVFFGEQAPNYEVLFNTIQDLSGKDVLLILGTSGAVLPVSQIARHAPCLTILNNLHASEAIDEADFHHVLNEPATSGLQRVNAFLHEHWGI